MATGPGTISQDLFPASPPPFNLLRVPGVLVQSPDERWINGVSTEPERCHLELDQDTATADYPYWWTCVGAGGVPATEVVPGGTKLVGDNPANIDAQSYQAWVGWACSSLGLTTEREAEVRARALRHLEACLPAIVEHELWTGEVADAQGADTPFLVDGTVDDLGAFGFVTALAELEQHLADCTCGTRHMIHAQPRTVTAWRSRGLVEVAPSQDHLRTVVGTVVVPGTGYPGTSPGGQMAGYGTSWAYGTGMVRVFAGTPTVGTVTDGAVDRPTNDVVLRAERPVLHTFSPCCHVGVGVVNNDEYARGGS